MPYLGYPFAFLKRSPCSGDLNSGKKQLLTNTEDTRIII